MCECEYNQKWGEYNQKWEDIKSKHPSLFTSLEKLDPRCNLPLYDQIMCLCYEIDKMNKEIDEALIFSCTFNKQLDKFVDEDPIPAGFFKLPPKELLSEAPRVLERLDQLIAIHDDFRNGLSSLLKKRLTRIARKYIENVISKTPRPPYEEGREKIEKAIASAESVLQKGQ